MAAASPHNRIINAIARTKLRPLGLQQKGRSRFWYDDRRWHGIAVEFQASSFSRMSYLNVGVSWFWSLNEHWTFDLGHRENPSAEFHEEAQFRRDFGMLVDEAIDAIHRYRDSCATCHAAYEFTSVMHEQCGAVAWPGVHLGLLAGLKGDAEEAREHLRSVTAQASGTERQAAQIAFCEKALHRVEDAGALRSWLEENIAACRQLRGLPPLEGSALPAH